ncbi:PE family protein [Mycobacterium paragordonae]|nr:PE family protein [Mycobacterium paragordonae]TDK86561.1 PE family protein [Mycobacterium paragordonae]
MSFVITQPEALTFAASKLEGLGSSMAAQGAAAAAATTDVIPAAADPISALQAEVFSAYGTRYQAIAAQAQAIQELLVSTLGSSAGAYGTTEAANAAAASSDSEFSSDDGYRMPARGSDPEISWPIECLS